LVKRLVSLLKPRFSLDKPRFSLDKALFSFDKPRFSLDKPRFSLDKMLFSSHKTLFSLDKPLFSSAERLSLEEKRPRPCAARRSFQWASLGLVEETLRVESESLFVEPQLPSRCKTGRLRRICRRSSSPSLP
jgi:hypothetical protein